MGKQVYAGWFGKSLVAGTGGMQNFGGIINYVYETEFKNMEEKPCGKKIMYKDGVPVNQKGNNNINNNSNKIKNDPYDFDKMSYEQTFGIKKINNLINH